MTAIANSLTWRQEEALLCSYWRIKNLSKVTLSDLVGDIGISFITLAGHLWALKTRGLIETRAHPRNMGANEVVLLTESGLIKGKEILDRIGASPGIALSAVQNLLKKWHKKASETGYRGYNIGRDSKYSKYFNAAIAKSPTEPVLTSIAMYTELDGKLSQIYESDKALYARLSKSKLNLEIRNARIASATIPLALRNQTDFVEFKEILENSWVWPGLVNAKSFERYLQESQSMGLVKREGSLIRSLKETPTDTIHSLSNKTNLAFQNSISLAPKACLVVYRESFKLPTEEDLFNPARSSLNLDWAQSINEGAGATKYKEATSAAFDILKDKTGIIEEKEGRLFPTTIIRKVNDLQESEEFWTVIKNFSNEDNIVANILLLINAAPGITLGEIKSSLRKGDPLAPITEGIDNVVNVLERKNLIYSGQYSEQYPNLRKLYCFTHLPYLSSEDSDSQNANASIRSYEPFLLSQIQSNFSTPEEKKGLSEVISKLSSGNPVTFETLESYGKNFTRRFTVLATKLPGIKIDSGYNEITIGDQKVEKILLDALKFSLLTGNDALSVYSNTIAELVERSSSLKQKFNDDLEIFRGRLIQTKLDQF